MLINIVSFNGLTLNSDDFNTTLLNPLATPAAKISFIEQAEADASDADAYTVDVQNKILLVKVKNWVTRYELMSQLKTAFKRGAKSDLEAVFSDDNLTYILPCRVVNIMQDPTYLNYFTVTLQTSFTAWRSKEKDSFEWSPTGEDSTVITVGGNDETRLIADMVFTSAPGSGYINQAIYQLPNLKYALGNRPWCIEMDTASIVSNGDMLASCDDLRVTINGSEVKRWIDSPNTANTKIWFNVTMNVGYIFALKTSIGTGAIDKLEFVFSADSNRDLSAMPTTGIFYHGNEWFAYNGFNPATLVATITARGAFDTDIESHTAGDIFTYIQNVVILKFGNPDATDPAAADANYDNTKPMLDLNLSDNLTWVWNGTSGFYDPNNPGRTAQWLKSRMSSLNFSNIYSYVEDAGTGDYAMGMKVINGTLQTEIATLQWVFSVTAPILSTITSTGKKMRDVGIISWPIFGAFALNSNGAVSMGLTPGTFNTPPLWIETAPTADGTFYTIGTHEDVAIPDGNFTKIVYFFYARQLYQGDNLGTYGEIDTTTITFDDVFTGAMLLEPKASITMDLAIENSTNGDSLSANYPLLANKTISIDSEWSTVTYDSYNFHSAIILNDETRSIFIRLLPGENTIALIGAVGSGTVTLSWYTRRIA